MTESQDVLTEWLEDGVLRITLSRPAKRNAITPAMVATLDDLIAWAGASPEVRVIVITGAGGAFSAGADLSVFAAGGSIAAGFVRSGNRMIARLAAIGKPVIAAIDGLALGGGFEIALGCSLRVASERAWIGLPEVTFGLIPAWGGITNLARLIGAGPALSLALTGTPIAASEALARGIFHRVVAHDEFSQVVNEIATRLAGLSETAIAGVIELAGGATWEREVELFDSALVQPMAVARLNHFQSKRAA